MSEEYFDMDQTSAETFTAVEKKTKDLQIHKVFVTMKRQSSKTPQISIMSKKKNICFRNSNEVSCVITRILRKQKMPSE